MVILADANLLTDPVRMKQLGLAAFTDNQMATVKVYQDLLAGDKADHAAVIDLATKNNEASRLPKHSQVAVLGWMVVVASKLSGVRLGGAQLEAAGALLKAAVALQEASGALVEASGVLQIEEARALLDARRALSQDAVALHEEVGTLLEAARAQRMPSGKPEGLTLLEQKKRVATFQLLSDWIVRGGRLGNDAATCKKLCADLAQICSKF